MKSKFKYRFEAAHRFVHGSSKCNTPHGHTWWVEISIETPTNKMDKKKGLYIPFENIKKDWKHWITEIVDHSFFLNQEDPLLESVQKDIPDARLLLFPCDPTTEAIACYFLLKANELVKDLEVQELTLIETPTNSISINLKDAQEFASQYPDFKLNK